MEIKVLNRKYEKTKLGNLFLGFFEGLFIDGEIHPLEIKALITWVEAYPDSIIPFLTHYMSLL